MSEVAGRLEIEVTSDTKGFAAALKRKIEAITKEVVAEVRASIDTDGLKADLEKGVKSASKGVDAKIGVTLKKRAEAKLRAELEAVAKAASKGVAAEVGVKVDKRTARELRDAMNVDSPNAVNVPARVDRKGLFASWLAARKAVQADAHRRPIELPLTPARFRSAFLPLLYTGIASLIQPIIGTLVGGVGGLAAMVANLSLSLKTLAAAPTILAGALGGFVSLVSTLRVFGEELDDLPAKTRKAVKAWQDTKKAFSEEVKSDAQDFIGRMSGSIERILKLFPLLTRANRLFLRASEPAVEMLGKWIGSKAFSSEFKSVTATAARSWESVSTALVRYARGLLHMMDAASPLVDRISAAIERSGKWAAGLYDSQSEADAFAERLDYAADKASQLWEMLKDLGGGIAGIFRAGREVGDRLLQTMQDQLEAWHEWVDSARGQNAIREWFEAIEPIAREAGGLIKDLVFALIRMSKDPNIGNMLKTLRDELLPTLERFLTNLGQQLGPSVIDLIQNILEVLTELSDAGSPIARGLGYISDGIGWIADVLRKNPRMAQTLGVLLGGLLAYRALAFIGKATGLLSLFDVLNRNLGGRGSLLRVVGPFALIIASLSGAFQGLDGPATGAAAALGTFLLLGPRIPAMTAALSRFRVQVAGLAAVGGGGFTGLMRGIGTTGRTGLRGAMGGLSRTLVGGLSAAVGGPIGVAVGAIAIAVGFLAEKHAKAKADAAAYKAHLDAISDSLDRNSGALTQNTREVVYKKLVEDGLVDLAKKHGVALNVLTDAALGSASAQAKVRGALQANIEKFVAANDTSGKFAQALEAAGVSTGAFAAQVVAGGDKAKDMRKKILDAARAHGIHGIEIEGVFAKLEALTDETSKFNGKVLEEAGTIRDSQKAWEDRAQAMNLTAQQVENVIETTKGVKDKKFTVEAMTNSAISKLKSLGYRVRVLPDGRVEVTATTRSAERSIAWAARKRYTTIDVRARMVGGRVGGFNAGLFADGGIIKSFADGGITRLAQAAGARVRHFASGIENHVAQIARAGEWRVWAEDETGGEAYIPLAKSKRSRSTAILAEVAKQFGYMLAPRVDSLGQAAAGLGAAMPGIAAAFAGAEPGRGFIGPRIEQRFEKGAISVSNPAPEPASRSIASNLRTVTEYGILEGDD